MSTSLTTKSLKGTWTALVTPFLSGGEKIDLESFERLIEFQIKCGVNGFVVCGSTGEAQCLSDDEYRLVAESCKSITRGRIPIIVGIGVSSTKRASELAAYIAGAKFDGVLLVAPPYVKPMQHGIVAHFRAVAKAGRLPIVAYNIPGRAACTILPQTIQTLCDEKLIIGLKDSTGSLENVVDVYAKVGDSISILSGEDALTHAIMASGGKGVISAAANLLAAEFVSITGAALKDDWQSSLRNQSSIVPVIRALYLETNPIPVKFALVHKGLISHPDVRLPLTPASEATQKALIHVIG